MINSAIHSGAIGPRAIEGWILQDVSDAGNCFYEAIIDQMRKNQHPFLQEVPNGTAPEDYLRLRVQRENFRDREYADYPEIFSTIQLLNVAIAIVDSRQPELGFTYYYYHQQHQQILETKKCKEIPSEVCILRLIYIDNH